MLVVEEKLVELNLLKNLDELEIEAKKMMGKTLITHQTGLEGKEVKRFISKRHQHFKRILLIMFS